MVTFSTARSPVDAQYVWTQLEYENLARGVKAAVLADPECVSAERLTSVTVQQLRSLFFGGWEGPLPLEDERVRLLQEVWIEKKLDHMRDTVSAATHNFFDFRVSVQAEHGC
eukprot:365961-Chlamydomonas_euryale.AAC.17